MIPGGDVINCRLVVSDSEAVIVQVIVTLVPVVTLSAEASAVTSVTEALAKGTNIKVNAIVIEKIIFFIFHHPLHTSTTYISSVCPPEVTVPSIWLHPCGHPSGWVTLNAMHPVGPVKRYCTGVLFIGL